jgi:DNA-binding CsgD family transcriptional regulator
MEDPEQQQSEAASTLTPLQCEILVLVMNGLTNREIGDRLGGTPGMVGTQIGRILRQLGLTHRAELVDWRRPELTWGRDGDTSGRT